MEYTKLLLLITVWGSSLLLVATVDETKTNITTASNTSDTKTIIELSNKDVKVITGSALKPSDIPLTQLMNSKEANQVKSRKVTQVGNYTVSGLENNKTEVEKKSSSTTTTEAPKTAKVGQQVSENIVIDLSNATTKSDKDNGDKLNQTMNAVIVNNKSENMPIASNNSTAVVDDKAHLTHVDKNNTIINNTTKVNANDTTKPTTASPAVVVHNSSTTTTTKAPTIVEKTNATASNATTTTAVSPGGGSGINVNKNVSTTTQATSTTTTTTSTTTTTTTTTTTPKPKKPTVTYGVEDFPDLDKQNPAWVNITKQQQQQSSSSKLPLPEAPYAQPSQENFNHNSFHGGRDYILPVVSMIFIIPLVIGVLITTYRRFRDCWSTRHYRRMDFLVDGMYND